jgi:hypothetical protein
MHLPSDVNAIKPEMILRLVENGVPENLWLDYKETLPGFSNDEKGSFLIDVSAFANSVGGHLIYGIRAAEGVPNAILGLPNFQADSTILRLTDLLKDSIEPRIPVPGMRYIDMNNGIGVFVISIPRSWAQPHAILKGQGTFRFYGRHSAGNYPFSLEELRRLFGQTGALVERIRRFRLERTSLIAAGEGTRVLSKRESEDDRFRALILHVVPLATFDERWIVDPQAIRQEPKVEKWLEPISGAGIPSYSFDGYFTFSQEKPDMSVGSYLQVFSNGIIEIADIASLTQRNRWGKKGYCFHTPYFELGMTQQLHELIQFYQFIQIPLPITVMLTMIGVEGYSLIGIGHQTDEDKTIREQRMFFPEVIIDSNQQSFEQLAVSLKPVFDQLWNAASYPKCPHFYRQGDMWLPTPKFLSEM